MKTLIAVIVAALTGIGFSQQPAADEAAAGIDKLREGLVGSFTKGDIDGLLHYLDEDVVVTWQNGELCRGREAVRAFYNRMMLGDERIVREIKSAPKIIGRKLSGDWAVSWGNLHDHFVLNDGSDLPFNSVFTATTAKHGDRWLVTAFHVSANVFENPVLSLATRKVALWVGVAGAVLGIVIGVVIARRRRS